MATERKRRRSVAPQRSPRELREQLASLAAATEDPAPRRRARVEPRPLEFGPDPVDLEPRRPRTRRPTRTQAEPSEPATLTRESEPAPRQPEPPPRPQSHASLITRDGAREFAAGAISTTPVGPPPSRARQVPRTPPVERTPPPQPEAPAQQPEARAPQPEESAPQPEARATPAQPPAPEPKPTPKAEAAAGGLVIGSVLGAAASPPPQVEPTVSPPRPAPQRPSAPVERGGLGRAKTPARDKSKALRGRSKGGAAIAAGRFQSRASGRVGRQAPRSSKLGTRQRRTGLFGNPRRVVIVVLAVILVLLIAIKLIGGSNSHSTTVPDKPTAVPVPAGTSPTPAAPPTTTTPPPAVTTPAATTTAATTTTAPHKTAAPAAHKAAKKPANKPKPAASNSASAPTTASSPTSTAATTVTSAPPVVVHRSAPRPSQPSFNPGGALPGKPTVRALRKQRAKHKR